MRITNIQIAGALLGLFLSTACRGNSDHSNPDAGGDGGDGQIHIQDVQSDTMAPGTAVSLHGVVVTAVDGYGAKTGDLWVEEPNGGPFSGIHVFGVPPAQVQNLVPGDIVDVTGAVKDEFALSSDTTGRTATELKKPNGGAITVTRTGTGAVPAPHVIDAVALGMMTPAERDAVYEKWEGVLITVQNVGALSAPVGFGGMPYADDSYKFEVDGKLVVESTQAAFPTSVNGATCLASVTGVEDYFFDWLILPRSTDEIVLGGTGCPVRAAVKVVDIQTGVATGNVQVNDVYVTAVGPKTIWVADALQGAANNGVAVFFNATAIDPAIVVGAKLSVRGTVSEFDVGTPKVGDTLTELVTPTITNITAPTAPPTPLAVATGDVNDIATGEPYEGVLVQAQHLKVTDVGTNNKVTLTDNAGGTIVMDDDIFVNYGGTATAPALPAIGVCYATLTGVMSVQLTDNVRTINPRAAADLVVGSGCPVTVTDIQRGVATGAVSIDSVFVTAIGANTLWVADALQGAPNNGVAVFFDTATLDPGIVVGAKLKLTGTVEELDVTTPAVGDTLTRIIAPTFSNITAPTAAPTPLAATAAQLSNLTTGEPFEGVLVQGTHFKVTAIGGGNQVTLTDDVGGTVVMDDDIFASFGGTVDVPALPAIGTCYATLTGVMSVQLTDNLRTINPRSAADLVSGTGCAAIPTATVVSIQTGAATGDLALSNVFVTAVGADTIWVADALQAAPNNGVAVVFGAAALDPGIVIGAKLSLQGTVIEADVTTPASGDTLTEIINPTFTGITAPTTAPTPVAVTAAQVSNITTSEPFEGVLVQGTRLKVTALGNGNQVTLTDPAGGTLVMDDDVFANYGGSAGAPVLPAVGDCYDRLTGVMSVQLTDNLRTINPRVASDLVVGTSCSRTTIPDVQNSAMAVGTAVELRGVVVTAIDSFGAKTGDFWVEEVGGGPFSGIKVFGAPAAQVAALAVGDLVDITGAVKDEFALASDTTGRTVTELKKPTGGAIVVTKTGTGAVPAPHLIDAVALGALSGAERDAEYEKWESVLITVQNVRAFSAPTGFGGTPFPVDAFKFEVNGKLVAESLLAGFPTGIDATTCFASITGVEDYFFDWLVLPRNTPELVTGGTGCPVTTPVTVQAIQTGAAVGNVLVDGAFVTAVGPKTIWIADSLQGAANNGVAVFFNATPNAQLVVGAKVSVSGSVSEFDVGTPKVGDTLTEIVTPTASNIVAPTAAPTPLVVTTGQVNDIVTGEPYEGVLVQGALLKVTSVGTNNKVTLVDNAGASIVMDDDVFVNYGGTAAAPNVPAVGVCYATVTGIMSVQLTDNIRTLNPRSAADLVVGAGCN